MTNEHPKIELNFSLSQDMIISEYPYQNLVRVIEISVTYDGETFSLQSDHGIADDEDDWCEEEITTFGWRHANLIACSFLALLEAYGQPHLLNDPDIQEDFSRMVQETKDFYAEKAFKQIRDGLKNE